MKRTSFERFWKAGSPDSALRSLGPVALGREAEVFLRNGEGTLGGARRELQSRRRVALDRRVSVPCDLGREGGDLRAARRDVEGGVRGRGQGGWSRGFLSSRTSGFAKRFHPALHALRFLLRRSAERILENGSPARDGTGPLAKALGAAERGKGGGRPDMAQGGGPDGPALVAALEGVRDWVAARLG